MMGPAIPRRVFVKRYSLWEIREERIEVVRQKGGPPEFAPEWWYDRNGVYVWFHLWSELHLSETFSYGGLSKVPIGVVKDEEWCEECGWPFMDPYRKQRCRCEEGAVHDLLS